MAVNGDNAAGDSSDLQKKRWLKRQAVQVSAMLPEDPADAVRVLDYALELQRAFLDKEDRPTAQLIRVPLSAAT